MNTNASLEAWPKDRLIQALEELKEKYNNLVKQNEETLKANVALSATILQLKNENAALKAK